MPITGLAVPVSLNYTAIGLKANVTTRQEITAGDCTSMTHIVRRLPCTRCLGAPLQVRCLYHVVRRQLN